MSAGEEDLMGGPISDGLEQPLTDAQQYGSLLGTLSERCTHLASGGLLKEIGSILEVRLIGTGRLVTSIVIKGSNALWCWRLRPLSQPLLLPNLPER